jgi:Cys-rich four helix bundle protein (predicted Tat secretion target)
MKNTTQRRVDKQKTSSGVTRREVLIGVGTLAASALASGMASAATEQKHDHAKHKPQYAGLLAAVNDCLVKGQQCIAHCLVVFQEGDTSLAECAAKVHEMQAICDAYSYLLAANSEYTRDYARLCVTACEDCEMECRRHDHHIECRDCAEACEKVVKLAKKLLA